MGVAGGKGKGVEWSESAVGVSIKREEKQSIY